MGAFFSSLGRTITAGVVLLIVIVLAVGALTDGGMRGVWQARTGDATDVGGQDPVIATSHVSAPSPRGAAGKE